MQRLTLALCLGATSAYVAPVAPKASVSRAAGLADLEGDHLRVSAGELEDLGRERAERLGHAGVSLQPHEELAAHGILEGAPAALVVRAGIVLA